MQTARFPTPRRWSGALPVKGGGRNRRGSALLLVLTTLAIMAVLGSGTVLSTLQEVRIGRRQALQVRAQAIAEYGLNIQLASWPSSRTSLAVGATETQQVTVAAGDVATVTIVRLTPAAFLVTSVGRASTGIGALEAERTVSQVVRATSVTVNATSTIATGHVLNLNSASGNATSLSGTNAPPPGWGSCAAGSNVASVSHASGSAPIRDRNFRVAGAFSPAPAATLAAEFDNLWGTLRDLTTLTLPTASVSVVQPEAAGTPASCTTGSTNWGEPYRSTGWGNGNSGTNGIVTSCQTRFPVIYRAGNLLISGNSRGQGILLVDGSLTIRGNLDWAGIIMARDQLDLSSASRVYGAVYIRGQNGTQSIMNGAAQLTYSQCAITQATSAIGGIGRVSQRPWAGLY